LEDDSKKEEPNQVAKKERIEETIRIMESIDMIIVQMENKEMKKEFASKKIELQKKREEVAAELRYLENEPEK
jgi:hypothetical protein